MHSVCLLFCPFGGITNTCNFFKIPSISWHENIHAKILPPWIMFAWITVALSYNNLREAPSFLMWNFLSPALPKSVSWLIVGVRCHFISLACCFSGSLASHAGWEDTVFPLCCLVSGNQGQSVLGYCRVQAMVLRLCHKLFNMWVPVCSLWAPTRYLWADGSPG